MRARRGGSSRGASVGESFGAQEITQARVNMRPSWGPTVHIARSVVYDLTRVATDQGFAFDWSLSDVPNASEFVALFAQWKLSAMAITFTWRSANEANPTRPIIYLALDPFASGAPASANEILERPNRSWSPNSNRTTLQLKVAARAINLVASGVGSGSLVLNSLAPPGTWYSTSGNNSTVSYGTLLAWVQGWTANSGSFTVKQDYMFCLRSSK